MTIKECIDIVDNLKPNQYSIENKVDWLSYIDHSIINEVLLTHEGYDGRYDDFTGYSADKLNMGLIVPSPYDRLYPAYLKMKIDEENGETARYNNSVTMFNAYLMEYKKWYNSKHMPLSPSDRRTLPPRKPSSMDVSEAQLEQLRKLLYAEFHDDMIKELSNDKLYAIVKSFMDTNAQMLKGKDGRDGVDGKDGSNGKDGLNGSNGVGIQKAWITEDGELKITLTNGVTSNLGVVKGEKGDRGERGMEGAKGDKGDRGEKGDKGDSGERGPIGPQGAQGYKGDKGDKGDKGEKGDKGDKGEDAPVIVCSASGMAVITSDSAKTPLKNLRVHGKSEQKQYGGHQLFDASYRNINGRIWHQNCNTTENNGVFTCVATGTDLMVWNILGVNVNYEDTDYACNLMEIPEGSTKVSVSISNTAFNKNYITFLDENKVTITTKGSSTSEFSINLTGNEKYFVIRFGKGDAVVGQTYETTVMVNIGELMEYEPYTGNAPSPSTNYQQEIVECENTEVGLYKENIFDNENATQGKLPVHTTLHWIKTNIQVKAGEVYYVYYSTDGVFNTVSTFYGSIDIDRSSNNPNLFKIANNMLTVPTDGELVIRLESEGSIAQVIDNLVVSKVPVDKYIPYSKQTLSIPYTLRGIGDVRDYVDFERNKKAQNINRKVITRDAYITANTTNEDYNMFVFTIHKNYHNQNNCVSSNPPVMCNKFIGVTSGTVVKGTCRIATVGDYGWNGDARIYFYTDKTITTIDEFMNAVGDDMYVDYVLAEPIETPLTEEEIAQFKALYMNYPNTTIINSDNAYMEVEYVADTKCYIDNKFKQLEMALANTNANLL